MHELFTADNAVALLTLTALEIVLGIDNIVFISILAGKLPPEQRSKARNLGLTLALVTRLLLLLSISWVMSLKGEIFRLIGHSFSGRDLILIIGGFFLVGKATMEIHHKLEGASETAEAKPKGFASFRSVVTQILLLDIVFSLDSVITAVGMARRVEIMVAAVIISIGVMLAFAGRISGFIDKHPTMKMLALSFLLLIGVTLVADGFGQHIDKGYIYAAMVFSLFVEVLNLRTKPKHAPVRFLDAPSTGQKT